MEETDSAVEAVLRARDHYEVLGAAADATLEDLRKRFLALCLQVHPDKSAHPGATTAIKKVMAAWSILKNTQSRIAYHMDPNSPEEQPAMFVAPNDIESVPFECEFCDPLHRNAGALSAVCTGRMDKWGNDLPVLVCNACRRFLPSKVPTTTYQSSSASAQATEEETRFQQELEAARQASLHQMHPISSDVDFDEELDAAIRASLASLGVSAAASSSS